MRPFHQSELEIIAASLAAEPPKEAVLSVRAKRILSTALALFMCAIFGAGVAFAHGGGHAGRHGAGHPGRHGVAPAHHRHVGPARRLYRSVHRFHHGAPAHHAEDNRPAATPRHEARMHAMLVRAARARHGARPHAHGAHGHNAPGHHNRKAKKPRSAKHRFFLHGALARTASLPAQVNAPAAGGPSAATVITVASGGNGASTASGSGASHLFNPPAGAGPVQAIERQVQAAARHHSHGTRSHRRTFTSTSTSTGSASGAGEATTSAGSTRHHSGGGQARTAAQPTSPGNGLLFPLDMPPSQIEHIVGVVPEELWIALSCALVLAAGGTAAAIRLSRRARIQAGQYAAVAAVALNDPLTGVLNRRGFTQAVERELARASRHEAAPFVLAYIDVRGLKAVNDTDGHHAGDELLQQVAGLLGDSVRAEDAVGRLGGDEFALLLTGPSARGAGNAVRRIRAKVPGYQQALGFSTPWDLTIGAAVYPIDGETFEDLLSTADREMYEQRGIVLR